MQEIPITAVHGLMGNHGEAEFLASVYRNSLRVAADHGIRSIAFPSISTGVYSYPVDQAAEIAVKTVAEFWKSHLGQLDMKFQKNFMEILQKADREKAFSTVYEYRRCNTMSITINGFSSDGNWYKGNLHCHTTDSDGSLKPSEVIQMYRVHGYSFLAISDHDIFSDYRQQYDCDDFILLPAIEASAVLYEDEKMERSRRLAIHHIHGILGNKKMQKEAKKGLFSHLEPYPARRYYGSWDGAKVAQELQDDLKAHGCITIYNHPVWSRVKEADFMETEGLTALEIYNYGTVNESATGFDALRWDVMLRNGKRIFATASDDNHNDGIVEDSFGGFIVVKAEGLDHESIINAMISGNYYSSSGPEIYDWGIRDNMAYVECSPVSRVNFMAGNYINAGGCVLSKSGGDDIARAEFELRGNEDYIRVECVDRFGKTAWSNPIFFRESVRSVSGGEK